MKVYMQKMVYLLILSLVTRFSTGCQFSKEEVIRQKNKCYSEKLNELKSAQLYHLVLSQFIDTFPLLSRKMPYLRDTGKMIFKIDEAAFFDTAKKHCLLIVLKKDKIDPILFGSARIIRGTSINDKWKFTISLAYNFDKDYFSTYPDNSFENISQLARYAVLTEGNIRTIKGCEIDEAFWFDELLK